jgi:meso-butanediol dehydrogenase/(S,S)-butanediol dehydrogenase/diacetyl reductase
VPKRNLGFQRFEGKLVIVTGAGSSMGAVTVRRFRDESVTVVLTGRPREKLSNVVSQFDQGRSLIHVSDVTKPDEQQDSARQY